MWFCREPDPERGDGSDRVQTDGASAVPDLVPRCGSGLDHRVHPGLPADDCGRSRGHLLLHQVSPHLVDLVVLLLLLFYFVR